MSVQMTFKKIFELFQKKVLTRGMKASNIPPRALLTRLQKRQQIEQGGQSEIGQHILSEFCTLGVDLFRNPSTLKTGYCDEQDRLRKV
jgi:hypothetical protein